jgi:predicted RNA-binding Zn-ribbon protein involved in translation (DUF1610 family)
MSRNTWPFRFRARAHICDEREGLDARQGTAKFNCPACQAEYRVVRVEAPRTRDAQLLCLSCGGPLHDREGKFVLKYFRVSGGANLDRRNGRRFKL